MKRHYYWLAVIPVIVAGGIWAYAQEPSSGQPPRNDIGRYAEDKHPDLVPNSLGGTEPRVIVEERVDPITGNVQRHTRTLQVPRQQTTQGMPLQGFPAQANGPAIPGVPFPPGVPAVASFPGQPGFAPELLELEDDKFKIISKENPTQEDWQTDRKAKEKLSIAMQKLKSTDGDDKEVEESRTLVSNYLDAQFDHDITKREKQIGDLQKQIDKLKSQLDKRKTSKEKMIEMRLTLMENETNGLGFPPAWNVLPTSTGPSNFYAPANSGPMPNFVPPQPAYANPSFPNTSSSPRPGNIFGNSSGYSVQKPSADLPENK